MNVIRSLIDGLLDIIYPPHCVVCNIYDRRWLCDECIAGIAFLEPPFCPNCGIPCTTGLCAECMEKSHLFKSANSAVEFSEPIVEIIHLFKYRGYIALADVLAQIMIDRFEKTSLRGKFDLIVAVPEHPSRIIERGFNQAEELAQRLSAAVGVEYAQNALLKTRKTSPQVGLQADKRASNLRGAYKAVNTIDLHQRSILVVDDVMTTGSTLDEAARALLDAGASSVRAYTLARSI